MAAHEAALFEAERFLDTAIASIGVLLGANIKPGDRDRIRSETMRNVRARVAANPRLPFDPSSVLSGATLGHITGEVERIKLAALGPINVTAAPRVDKDAYPILEGRYQGKNFIRALPGERAGSERKTASYSDLPGSYTAANLPFALRGHIDAASGITAGSVADAANWLQRIGVTPGPYAGYFAGSSQAARETLAGYIRNGDKIDSSKIKDGKDVAAVIGALKLKGKDENDPAVPNDMREIIKRMKKDDVDLNDPKAIRKYYREHQQELEAARKDTQKLIKPDARASDVQVDSTNKLAQERAAASASKPQASAKPKEKTTSLDLG